MTAAPARSTRRGRPPRAACWLPRAGKGVNTAKLVSEIGDLKRFVNIAAPEISPEAWRQLWAPVTYADLLKLDALIKDTGPSVEELRRLALKMKNSPPFSQAVIQVNPKIDNTGQRRLQCSLRFADFFNHLLPGADRKPSAHPALWGVEYPGPIASPPRNLGH